MHSVSSVVLLSQQLNQLQLADGSRTLPTLLSLFIPNLLNSTVGLILLFIADGYVNPLIDLHYWGQVWGSGVTGPEPFSRQWAVFSFL